LQVLNDKDNVAFDAEGYSQVLNGNNVALSEQPGDGNQRIDKRPVLTATDICNLLLIMTLKFMHCHQ
jgi:hypothetical protein